MVKVSPITPPDKVGELRDVKDDEDGHLDNVTRGTLPNLYESLKDAKDLWERMEENPRFFGSVQLAQDGGFSEVGDLFTMMRFPQALLAVGTVAMNVYMILYTNLKILFYAGAWTEIRVQHWDEPTAIQNVLGSIAGARLVPMVFVAILELCLLLVFMIWSLYLCGAACKGDRFYRWHRIKEVFWVVVPKCAGASAMGCLGYVAPSVLIPQFLEILLVTIERRGKKYFLPIIGFVLVRIVALLVGYEAFVVKFLTTAQTISDPATSTFESFLLAFGFLNQCLGIIQVSIFVQDRLFMYVFGGEDAHMSDTERNLKTTWLAMLTQRIWRCAKDKKHPIVWFLAVMLSYSDADFQKLTLNKRAIAGCIEKTGGAQSDGTAWK